MSCGKGHSPTILPRCNTVWAFPNLWSYFFKAATVLVAIRTNYKLSLEVSRTDCAPERTRFAIQDLAFPTPK